MLTYAALSFTVFLSYTCFMILNGFVICKLFDSKIKFKADTDGALLRAKAPGWGCIAMHDPVGRRGLWTRIEGDSFELCSGREGDDYVIKFSGLTDKQLYFIADVMHAASFQISEAADRVIEDGQADESIANAINRGLITQDVIENRPIFYKRWWRR
jgi:hypothetical protein